ncbi:MAG: NAD(P)-binding domain-containing protein [Deinococcales bacterium]
MKIAVVGAGNIGSTLGQRWLEQGHSVHFAVRDLSAEKVQTLKNKLHENKLNKAMVSVIQEALPDAEVILLAVPGKAVKDLIETLHPKLDDKIIIDASNNLAADVMHNFDRLRQLAPKAKLYQAFNSLGWENFANPSLMGQPIDHFYAGMRGMGS